MTDPLGQSQVIPYLVGLSKKGFKIHILSCEKKKNYSENKVHISELLKKNNIDWHPVIYTKSPPVLSTLWDIWRMRRKAIRLHKKENFSIVHCRSYIPSIIGLHLKKAYQVKFIFDMRGFWADERLDGNIWNIKNPFYNFIYKYFKKKENLFLSNADYTISLTEKAKNIIQQWNTIPNQPIPIQVIPCCTDTDHFSRAKINPKTVNLLRNEIGISHDDFIISYLGSLGTWYLLDEMLLFFKLLLKSKPRSKFFFITHEDSQKIVNAALKQNIPIEKIIVKHANREELPSFLSLSNLSIFFIKPTFSKYASSPTKLGELLSM